MKEINSNEKELGFPGQVSSSRLVFQYFWNEMHRYDVAINMFVAAAAAQ